MLTLTQQDINHQNSQSIDNFKKEIDILKNEYFEKVNKILKNENVGTICTFSLNDEQEINNFVNIEEWKNIDTNIYYYITTFYNFHSNTEYVLNKLKSFLYKLNPVWDAAGAVSDFLSAMTENNGTITPEIDAAIAIGKTISMFLSTLHQDEEKLKYSKQFIIDIFATIDIVSKTKNISLLLSCLKESKEALDKIALKFEILLTLPIAKRKVSKSLEYVNNIFILAKERYHAYIRDNEWGSSWY